MSAASGLPLPPAAKFLEHRHGGSFLSPEHTCPGGLAISVSCLVWGSSGAAEGILLDGSRWSARLARGARRSEGLCYHSRRTRGGGAGCGFSASAALKIRKAKEFVPLLSKVSVTHYWKPRQAAREQLCWPSPCPCQSVQLSGAGPQFLAEQTPGTEPWRGPRALEARELAVGARAPSQERWEP